MYYHLFLTSEYPQGTYSTTREYLHKDLSREHLDDLLSIYRRGLPLPFERDVVKLDGIRSIFITSTEQRASIILPPLKKEFERKAAIEKAQEEAEYRRKRIAILNPFDVSGVFMERVHLRAHSQNITSEFIQPFTTNPENHVPTGDRDVPLHSGHPLSTVTLLQQRRFRYLEYLYSVSQGDSSRMFHWREVGAALEMTDDVAAVTCCYLREKKLTNGVYKMDGISQPGIDEYEQAINKPEEATPHFQPHTTINAGQNANVMIGSPNSRQVLTNHAPSSEMAGMTELIHAIREVIGSSEIDTHHREDVETIVEELELQSSQPQPDRKKIRAGLRSLASDFTVGVLSCTATPYIVDELHRFIQALSSMPR